MVVGGQYEHCESREGWAGDWWLWEGSTSTVSRGRVGQGTGGRGRGRTSTVSQGRGGQGTGGRGKAVRAL